MILIDVNLLVYAYNTGSDLHKGARSWLEAKLTGAEAVGLPWPSLLGFLRVATNPRALARPLRMPDAVANVQEMLDLECVFVPQATGRHLGILTDLTANGGVTGNLVPDAHLAALAIEHGLTLCSTDRNFSRFEDLRWINPLA